MWNVYDLADNLVAERVTRTDIESIKELEEVKILTESGDHIEFSNGWYAEVIKKLNPIKPDYYNSGKNDLISNTADTVEPDEFREVMKFNIKKYITRYDKKNGVQDLNKAVEYLMRLKEWEIKEGHPMKCQRKD